MNQDWPFDQPENCAVITLRDIAVSRAPILRVSHDLDDHGWQFLGWETPDPEDAAVVRFREVLDLDPTVMELADLPPGWRAWRRTPHDDWTREPNPHAHD